jgi:copper(I)-binding protein
VGDQVEVTMAIVNSGRVDDRLIDVTGPEFSGASVSESPTAADTPHETSYSEPDPAATVALSGQPPAVGTTAVDVLVPARGAVFVGSSAPTVVLTGLTRRIDAAQSMELTLTFARAGQTTVPAITGSPPDVLPRTSVVDL